MSVGGIDPAHRLLRHATKIVEEDGFANRPGS